MTGIFDLPKTAAVENDPFAVEAQPAETDYVVERQGARVYVDPFSAQDVDGGTIDYVPAGESHVFTLTPPRSSARAPKLVA